MGMDCGTYTFVMLLAITHTLGPAKCDFRVTLRIHIPLGCSRTSESCFVMITDIHKLAQHPTLYSEGRSVSKDSDSC
eukprot:4387366-Amphidinium_carterae.1